MSIVNLPYMPRSRDSEALKACIRKTAAEYGLSQYTALLIVESIFEHIAAEVTGGEVVRIGGFGVFGPGLRTPRSPNEPSEPYVAPRFSPAKGFRNMLRACCPPERVRNRELRRHAKRSSPSSRRGRHSTVFTAAAQARKIVKNLPGCPEVRSGILP